MQALLLISNPAFTSGLQNEPFWHQHAQCTHLAELPWRDADLEEGYSDDHVTTTRSDDTPVFSILFWTCSHNSTQLYLFVLQHKMASQKHSIAKRLEGQVPSVW